MSHGMTPEERRHAFEERGLKMCSPKLYKEYRQLKRENAMMRQWVVKLMSLVEMNGPAADVYCEIQVKMPTLFKESK